METYITKYKSNSGKDIRDIVYLNEPLILSFKNEDCEADFLDYVTSIISYFGFVTIKDILCYYSKDHNFISSSEYGWGIEDLDRSSMSVNSSNDEIIWSIPTPKPINEIFMPKYIQ